MSRGDLTRETRRTLRNRGWRVEQRQARRPEPYSRRDVLEVGVDVRVEGDEEAPFDELEENR